MANTITRTQYAVTLSAMDSDWLWNEAGSYGGKKFLQVHAIMFKAGGTSANTLMLRDGSITGPFILSVTQAANAVATYLYGGCKLRPCMDYSECTFTSGALVSIIFNY